jgi:uncharacterized protein
MSGRRARARLVSLLLVALTPLAARAQGPARDPGGPLPVPAATGYVNDAAGLLDEGTRAKLEAFLDQVERRTGAEFAVLTVPTTAPEDPSAYKVRVFEAWGLGKKGADNGLLMLVAVEEREVRFETGYGLEGALPDGLQSRIFRDRMRPRFREGDYAGGIVAGVQACAARIAAESGVTLEWDGRELRYDAPRRRLPPWVVALIVIFVLGVVLVAARAERRHGSRGWHGTGPRGGGWSGGWGGGWGGSFGGGGGSSFGGFGGGMSGGGGGGGSCFGIFTSGVGTPAYCGGGANNTISGGAGGAAGTGGFSGGAIGGNGSAGLLAACTSI